MVDAGGSAPVEDAAAQGGTGPVLPDSAARDGLPMGKLRGRVLAKGTRAFVFAAAITVIRTPPARLTLTASSRRSCLAGVAA